MSHFGRLQSEQVEQVTRVPRIRNVPPGFAPVGNAADSTPFSPNFVPFGPNQRTVLPNEGAGDLGKVVGDQGLLGKDFSPEGPADQQQIFDLINLFGDDGFAAADDRFALREQFVRDDSGVALERIDERIQAFEQGADFADQFDANSRARFEQVLAEQQVNVAAAGQSAQQRIADAAGITRTAIQDGFERASANAIDAALGETKDAGEGFVSVFGGSISAAEQARQEERISDSMSELQNLVDGNVASTANIQQRIAAASSTAASAQIEMINVRDQSARAAAQLTLDTQLRTTIDNLLQQRDDIERNRDQALAAMELDRNAAEAQAAGRVDQFSLGYEVGAQGAAFDGLDNYFTSAFERAELQLTGPQEALFGEFLNTYLGGLNIQRAQTAAEFVQVFSQETGVDPQVVGKWISDATTIYDDTLVSQQVSEFSPDIQYSGGSRELADLIFSAANSIDGLPPGFAESIANSNALHSLIDIQSGGKVGMRKGGDLVGLGGLPVGVYTAIGADLDSVLGDPILEMQVLLKYIVAKYGGDPAAALAGLVDSREL